MRRRASKMSPPVARSAARHARRTGLLPPVSSLKPPAPSAEPPPRCPSCPRATGLSTAALASLLPSRTKQNKKRLRPLFVCLPTGKPRRRGKHFSAKAWKLYVWTSLFCFSLGTSPLLKMGKKTALLGKAYIHLLLNCFRCTFCRIFLLLCEIVGRKRSNMSAFGRVAAKKNRPRAVLF